MSDGKIDFIAQNLSVIDYKENAQDALLSVEDSLRNAYSVHDFETIGRIYKLIEYKENVEDVIANMFLTATALKTQAFALSEPGISMENTVKMINELGKDCMELDDFMKKEVFITANDLYWKGLKC